MTTHTATATYPATFAPVGRLDPVRARVTVQPQLTNDQILKADASAHQADTMHLLPDTRNGGPRRPHPGDIIYWVACVGGACLLLIAATT